MRLALLVCLAGCLAGCLGDAGVICDDGTLCPDDTTCAVVDGRSRCVSADQRSQCAGLADRTSCRISGQPIGVCHDQICVRAGCGDSFVTGAEECDGNNLGDGDTNQDGQIDCRDVGYYDPGALACRDDCTFDRNGCSTAGRCGDGTINGDEECDGETLPLGTACEAYPVSTASGVNFHPGGSVACAFDCTLAFAGCTGGFCGDGVKQTTEACDGFDVGAETCAPYSGNVTCSADCSSVIHHCAGSCGDSIVNGPEACDRAGSISVMPAGISCATYGFDAGAPTCSPACDTIDIAACENYCGDGILQSGESCDGADQAGADCSTFGTRGALGCDASCQRDFSSCQTGGWIRRTHPTFGNSVFAGVWSQNSASAFVFGQSGVWQWNGTAWIAHHLRADSGLPSGTQWQAIWGDERNVWVAAADTAYRYEPLMTSSASVRGVWVPETVGSVGVQGLWGNGVDLYAATTNGIYRRASSTSWVLEPGTSNRAFLSIHGRGDTVVAVGPWGVYRKLGAGAWVQIESSSWRYVSVWSASTIWLATTSIAAIYREGSPSSITSLVMPPTFQSPNTPLVRGIFAAASDDVYVAVQGTPNALLRWNGAYQGNAPVLTQLSIGTLPALGALGGSGAGDIWLCGFGAVFHHDGGGWQPPVIAPPSIPVFDHAGVAVTASNVWFGGATTLVAYDVKAPTSPPYVQSSTPGLTALWANDNDVLWIANGTAVSAVAAAPPAGTSMSHPAIAAWGTGDHVFFLSETTVAHFDGATWSEEVLPTTTTTPRMRAISGSSPDDVWAVGGDFTPQIFHRSSGAWTSVPSPTVSGGVTAVFSVAPADAWSAVAIPNGDIPESRLAHWDGTSWSTFGPPIPLAQILSIWGADPFDIWAVGTSGTVLHYDGQRWTPIGVPTFDDLVAVDGSSRDYVWAVGKNGVRLQLTHSLPAIAAGRCAQAIPLYCGGAGSFGTTFGDASVFYRMQSPALPYPTTLALAVTGDVELTVHRAISTDDLRCDLVSTPVAPLMLEDPTSFSMSADPGETYYIEVRRAAGAAGATNSYALTASCDYAPAP